MRPLSLTLKNFIGIRSGLGLEVLELDLDAITDGAQLVALTGPNGTGKSTVLDNLHPYRIMPSRAGSYSPGAFSYYDQVHGPEAGKELVWEHGGTVYRSSLIFKQTTKTKKTEAYLHERDGADWTPVTLPDNTVSDGKADTYDRCVEHILGSAEMFFTAAFSAQGRKSLSSYSNGDIKGLLSELLGLEHIRELGVKAKDVAKGVALHLDAMRGDLARIEEQEAAFVEAGTELATAEGDLKSQSESKGRARIAVGEASRNLAEVQSDANANTETEIRRQELTSRLESARQRVATAERNAEQDIAAEQQRRQSAERDIGQDIAAMERQQQAAKTHIERNQAMLNRRDEVGRAKDALPRLQSAERDAIAALDATKQAEQQRVDLKAEADRIADALAGIQREGKRLAEQCAALHDRSTLTGEVPCRGTDLQGRCQLLAEAIGAQKKIPAAEQDTEAKRAEYRDQYARLGKLHADIAELGDTRATVHQCETDLENIRQQIRETEQVLAIKDAIAQAEEAIAAAEAEIQFKQQQEQEHASRLDHLRAQLDERGDTRAAVCQRESALEESRRKLRAAEQTAALEQSITQAQDAITAAETQIAETRETLDAKRLALSTMVADSDRRVTLIRERAAAAKHEIAGETARIEQELSLLPPPADTSALEQAQQALEVAERSLSTAEQAVTSLNTRIGTLNERVRGLERALTGAGDLKAKARRLECEIAQWTALAKAFGNDGIVALTIDDAGPTLAALTNDLLLSCYGSRFSVAIRTQAENAKGDMKETFDIVVFDGERGDEKSVRAMSGGERIWINEALTRAMALYQAQASGQQYECLFADESDGALDPERKQQFMHMKREVIRLGGYRQEFFISHTPELWDMADATINLEELRAA